VLPPNRIEELSGEVAILLTTMQKKPKSGRETEAADRTDFGHQGCANLFLLDSKRDAAVSPERHHWSARESQVGFHLIQQNTKPQKIPSPTPSQEHESQKAKDSPDEDEPEPLLKLARAAFTGPMNDFGDHLFDSSRPPAQHLANGAGEWEEFGFDSLAVEAAAWCGEVLVLVLSAYDPAAAERGLYKYRKTWEPSLRKWFECEVQVELRQAQRKW
jgi:hypothetical protein